MKYIVALVLSISAFAFKSTDYQISFFSNGQSLCAGTLISQKKIITTASCALILVSKKASLSLVRHIQKMPLAGDFKVQGSTFFTSLEESSPPYLLMSHNLAVLHFSYNLVALTEFPQIVLDERKANQLLLDLGVANIHKIRTTFEGNFISLNGADKAILQEGYGLIREEAGQLKLLGMVQAYSLLGKETNLVNLVGNKYLKIEAKYTTSKGNFFFNLSQYIQSLGAAKEASETTLKLISNSAEALAVEIIESVTHESVKDIEVNFSYTGKVIINYFDAQNTAFIQSTGIK